MVQNYHVTAYRGLVTLSTLGANTQPLQITKLWKQHPGSCVCGWQKGGGGRVRWRRNLRSMLTVLEPSLELLQDWRMWSRHREWLEQEDSNSLMWGKKICPWKNQKLTGELFDPHRCHRKQNICELFPLNYLIPLLCITNRQKWHDSYVTWWNPFII